MPTRANDAAGKDHAASPDRGERRGAVQELQSIAPYARPGAPRPVSDVLIQCKWLSRYGGAVHGRTGAEAEGAAARLSPDYTDRNLERIWAGVEMSVDRPFYWVVRADLSGIDRLETPLILFRGAPRRQRVLRSGGGMVRFRRGTFQTADLVRTFRP